MNNPKISIIIVNYKVKERLFACINSIYGSKPRIPFEIIVVDNDEENVIGKELLKLFPDVKYIKSPSNLGYGGGNNLGAKSATGDYLFFLNPDTLVKNDAIEQLYKFIKSKNNIGIVSPLLVDNNSKPFKAQSRKELTPLNAIYSFSFLRKFLPNKNIYNDDFFRTWDKTTPMEAETIPGAALMISKKLFDTVNGFDEHFFLYFEENDLSKRIKKIGYKLFIYPKSIIIHQVGQSTKNVNNIEGIYSKSRYLYFKKHYGVLKALFVESFLRINKTFFLILLTLLLALSLRIYNLSQSMIFIGDQGWFYLSARDLLIQGEIPLVGITSSHTWLHQGPLWTYMLSIVLYLFNFNPLAGGYLTAIFGVLTTFLVYKLGSSMFSVRVGFIAALLYAVSPLIVFFDRMPFDPSPIPFFTILYFYSIFKWIKGKNMYFPLIIIFLAILYNLELATFSLFFPLLFIFIYGLYKRKHWIKNILNKKIFFYSVIGFISVMASIIVYDFANGFKQTVVFLGWIFIYKPFSLLFRHSQDGASLGIAVVIRFLLQNIQKIVFEANQAIALFLFSLSVAITANGLLKKNKFTLENPKLLLLIFLIISIGGILINKSPSDAYLPIIFPLVILLVAIFFDYLISKKRIRAISIIFFFLIIVLNGYVSYKSTLTNEFAKRVNTVNEIINLTNGEEYNLVGKGPGSQFKSFTMNYEYLLWWKGHPPTNKNVKLKIIISEKQNGIIIRKND